MTDTFGQVDGEVCRRDGCQGVVKERAVVECRCFLSAPCNACTTPREYCAVCGWEVCEEVEPYNDFLTRYATPKPIVPAGPRPLNPQKIDWHTLHHSNSSQLCIGVYPVGATVDDIEKLVRGTFGGRFKFCRDGRFEYIAYTD